MKFTVNRKIMLEYLKSMYRIIPKSNIVPELMGFLIEANDEDGYLYLTANNLEYAMQRKLKSEVETGGSFIMKAKMLTDILLLLGGDDVTFEEIKPGIVEIRAEQCVYTMPAMSGEIYPRPDMPFPQDTVKVTALKQLYLKTVSAAQKGDASDVLSGIHMEISPNQILAVGCNRQSIAVATNSADCRGKLSCTLPKAALSQLLPAIGNDDEIEVGENGPFLVFMKESMMFSTKHIPKPYVEVNKIIGSVNPTYTAKAEYEELKNRITEICDIASLSSEQSFVKLDFEDDSIKFSVRNDIGSSSAEVSVIALESAGNMSFYYTPNHLSDIFKTIEGTMILQVNKLGIMLVFDKNNKYMIMPVREQVVEKQMEKLSKPKKKSKVSAA